LDTLLCGNPTTTANTTKERRQLRPRHHQAVTHDLTTTAALPPPPPPTHATDGTCCQNNLVQEEHLVKSNMHPLILLPPEPNSASDTAIIRDALHKVTTEQAHARSNDTVPVVESEVPKRKVVVLQRETRRCVVNLDDLVRLLQEKCPHTEFVKVPESDLAHMSLLETARVFFNANVLIGGHGAGLCHMIWLRPPPSSPNGSGLHEQQQKNATAARPWVVQIMRPGQGGNVYGGMAKSLNLSYVDTVNYTHFHDPKNNGHNSDVEVDVLAAEKALRPILQN